MEAQKGFSPLLIRSVGLTIIGLLALLSPGSLNHPTSAQIMAYPLVPLALWSDGHNVTEDIAYGLAVDFQGSAVVVGTSGIVKYSKDGRKLWQVPYPGIAYGVATDSLADIVIAGTGGLVKLSSEGERLWARAGAFRKVTAVAGDRLVVCGPGGVELYSPEGERLGGLAYPGEAYGLAGSGEIVAVIGTTGIIEYDLQGREQLWRVAYPGEPQGVALDSMGSVIVVGSEGISKYGPNGRLIWQRPFLGQPQAVATIPPRGPSLQGDEIVVSGGFKDKDWDYRTVKYDPEGEQLWDVRYDGGQGDDIPYAVAVSPIGRIYVTGASTLAKGAAVDKDYYTIQYGEKPLPEAMVMAGRDGHECSPGTLPLAEFELSNPSPLTDEPISFINRSRDPDGYLLAWSWAFGDGGSSQAWEPEHRYDRKGRYIVVLTVVDNDFCTATAEASLEIGNRPPEADFSWTPLTPTDLEEALFTPEFEDSDGEVVYARWELGDGTIVEWDSKVDLGPPGHRNQLPHQYPDDGIYLVRLIVTDDDGAEAEVIKEITILNVPPEASFTWEGGEPRADFTWTVDREAHGSYPPGFDPSELVAGLDIPFEVPTELDDVLFEDRSSAGTIYFSGEAVDHDGRVARWHWDFGDGETSEEQNPSHQYEQAGTYHVALTVTDDDGDTSTYEADVEIGEIVAWRWEGAEYFPHFEPPEPEPPPWWDPYHCSFISEEQNPTAWFEDECYFELTLTVWDAAGNSGSITKPFFVINVPPVADFSWSFGQPPGLLPTCAEVGAMACQEPEMPQDAGVLVFEDLSYDSGQWSRIAEWEWTSNPLLSCWEPEEGCLSVSEPKLIGLSLTEGWPGPIRPRYLLYGDFEVQLSVWDDDGAGREDFPSSNITKTVTIDNIPPYAAFEWEDLGNESMLFFPFCTAYAGCIPPPRPFCIDHDVAGYSGCGGIFTPWGWAEVRVGIHSTEETVEITETIPDGWVYMLTEYEEDCVTISEQGENYWKANIVPANCSQYPHTYIRYELYPPYQGPLGRYNIETSAIHDGITEPPVYTLVELQAQVIATQWLQFHGYGPDEAYFIDPNGDELISWDWQWRGRVDGVASGQDPTGDYCSEGWCEFTLGDPMVGLRCQFDEELWAWVWSTDLAVSLTVTDELGASTTVEATIPLSGPCD